MEAAHSFRVYLKNHMQPRKGRKILEEKPTHAIIWVAKTYPPWQCTVLSTLKKLHEVCSYLTLFLVYTSRFYLM